MRTTVPTTVPTTTTVPSFGSSCTNQIVTVNQWLEADYNYGDAFDMNYFTAPYNGLYQFYVNIKLRSDTTSYIYMNSLIYFLVYRMNHIDHIGFY